MNEQELLSKAKFELGQVVATPGVMEVITREWLDDCLQRHVTGDWGELPPEDVIMNEQALTLGNRIMSVYPITEGVEGGRKFWIITEADRSSTTALLPDEY